MGENRNSGHILIANANFIIALSSLKPKYYNLTLQDKFLHFSLNFPNGFPPTLIIQILLYWLISEMEYFKRFLKKC